MQAIGERIIVKEPPAQEWSAGKVYLPPSAREERNIGEVVSVGTKFREDVKVGDTVVYTKYDGQEIKHTTDEDGNVLVILHEKEILAVVVEP